VLRRAAALQAHPLTSGAGLGLNPQDANALGVSDGSMVKVTGAAGTATLPVVVSAGVPRGGAWIEAAYVETAALPAYGAELSISKA
jgi:NADH-quinone oxidoreductase subunit G